MWFCNITYYICYQENIYYNIYNIHYTMIQLITHILKIKFKIKTLPKAASKRSDHSKSYLNKISILWKKVYKERGLYVEIMGLEEEALPGGCIVQ